jgi:regulator of sigma E protease
MGFITTTFYFIVVVGILVFIHEFGHFIAARISKMRVDVFAVGMGFRLFGWNRKTGFTFGKLPDDFDGEGHTDYRLSAFPIGGYVKISGMIDESMDAEFIQKPPEPWEFRSKNAFLKAFTISAGVIMNALLAIMIFSIIALTQGSYHNATTEVGFVQKASLSEEVGIQVGDRIVSINDNKVFTWQDMLEQLAIKNFGGSRKVEVNRSGKEIVLFVDGDQLIKAVSGQKPLGLAPLNSYVYLNSVETLKPAGKSGLKEGDTIITINGETIKALSQFVSIVSSSKEKPVSITYKRKTDTCSLSVTPDAQGLIGVGLSEYFYGPIIHRTYDVFEAMGFGWNETISSVDMFFNTFRQIFKGNISAKQSLGGPILIAKSASQRAEMGLASFLHFVALLSITLAVVNILPIPALDGGHLLFIIIEAIIRREVPIKAKMFVQQIGLGIIILLMVFMFYNDIARLFGW